MRIELKQITDQPNYNCIRRFAQNKYVGKRANANTTANAQKQNRVKADTIANMQKQI